MGGLVRDRLQRRPDAGDEAQLGDVTLRVEAMDGPAVARDSVRFGAERG